MSLASKVRIDPETGPDLSDVPRVPGIVRLSFHAGRPYVGRTISVRRRLERLLDPGRSPRTLAALEEASYQAVGSPFEAAWRLYKVAAADWPDDYRRRLRLRCPTFLRLILSNEYPRTTITTRLQGGRSLSFGPFRTRPAAERFESELLDFFTVRRCVENLEPSPDHPGCVYGEIGRCSRPCQAAVTPAEYRIESGRLLEALATGGKSLERELTQARDRSSETLEFEEAARQHAQVEKLHRTLRLIDQPARRGDPTVHRPGARPAVAAVQGVSDGPDGTRLGSGRIAAHLARCARPRTPHGRTFGHRGRA